MAKKVSKTAKEISLEGVLWNCRNILRSIGSTEKNRNAVIGLIFLKFAGDKFKKRREEIITEHGNNPIFLEKPSFYLSKSIFYLPEKARWDYIVNNASSESIFVILDSAITDIEEKNPPLQGALPKNFYVTSGAAIPQIKSLIDEINKIDEKRFAEEDLIGRVYEYFLQAYAVAGNKEDGEFYTPACIVNLIAELIEPYSGVVYDPCCGSGGMFVQSLKFVESHNGNSNNISIIGQESNLDTWRLCKMNLAIRGIAHDLGKGNGSTFTNDQHKDKKVNYIMANPPFNLKDWRGEDELKDDYRWNGYEPPRKANANYAWILHMLSKLDVQNGIAGFLLANGALNDGDDFENRKKLIENDKVEAIIVLPRDMFYTTDISVTLWIINNNKKAGTLNEKSLIDRRNKILFVDLRKWDKNEQEYKIDDRSKKKKVIFSDEQITDIKKLYVSWRTGKGYKDVPELCKSVSYEEIKKQNYSLAPSKYIEFIDHDLEIDYKKEMKRIQSEMKDIMKIEKQSQNMLEEAFRGIGYGID